MDDWRFYNANDDSEQSEGGDPSIEGIVTAFREALNRRRGQEEDTGSLEHSSSGEEPDEEVIQSGNEEAAEGGGEEGDEAGPELEGEEASLTSSQRKVIEDTIRAFREARHRAHEAEEEPQGSQEQSSPHEAEQARESDRRAEESEELSGETEEAPLQLGDSMEEVALAFREALEERGHSETGAPGEGTGPEGPSKRSEHEGRSSSGSPEPEMEPTEQVGDGVPFSEGVEMSHSEASAPSADPSARPTGPGSSFLWVTDHSENGPSSVSVDQLSEPRARNAAAFLLEGGGEKPYELLRRIRGHSEASIYLKPVFWVHAGGQESPVAEHVDGEWEQGGAGTLDALQQQASAINRRIRNIVGSGGEGGTELRVLRFMATRDHEFAPQYTAQNPEGFVYPKLTPIFGQGAQGRGSELVQVLSVLEERRLVTGEFVMRQHACRDCGSGFLNFEEMCPYCESTNLDTEDLVHHFRCAFTGPLSEFKREKGKLVCPKCDRYLKQVGVDYDKPSVVHTCRRCHEQFQDPEVQTTCYQCGHTYPPEEQIMRQVKRYEVTALGEETAVYGLSNSLLSILERESRLLDYATFELVVESEAARIERYQRSTSSLLLVRVAGLQQLRMELGQRSREVVEEIATAFDNTLRASDYLSARDESLYLFLLTETDEEGARRAGERLEQNIEGMLNQNLEHPPHLDVAVQPLRPGVELDEVAEQFLASRTQRRASKEGR